MDRDDRELLRLLPFMLFTVVLFLACLALLQAFQDSDVIGALIMVGTFYLWAKAGNWYDKYSREPRKKPSGYVGKFRRPDGAIVHVMREDNGLLWAASEEQPGIMPRNLGAVSGRDLAHWHKLSSAPDGNERITRPD